MSQANEPVVLTSISQSWNHLSMWRSMKHEARRIIILNNIYLILPRRIIILNNVYLILPRIVFYHNNICDLIKLATQHMVVDQSEDSRSNKQDMSANLPEEQSANQRVECRRQIRRMVWRLACQVQVSDKKNCQDTGVPRPGVRHLHQVRQCLYISKKI